jgi:hypothetical protein
MDPFEKRRTFEFDYYKWRNGADKLMATILSNDKYHFTFMGEEGMIHTAVRNKRQGRKVQTELAKRLGGDNVGTLGGEDIKMATMSVEAKHCAKFVGEKFMEQAEKNCPEGKTAIVIVHTKGKRFARSIVLMRMGDWEDWYGKLIPKGCSTCSLAEEGVCYNCKGKNFGHATEISDNGYCANYNPKE